MTFYKSKMLLQSDKVLIHYDKKKELVLAWYFHTDWELVLSCAHRHQQTETRLILQSSLE